MANLKVSLSKTLGWEGGYANDPHDSGGPTWKGVTLNTYKSYCRRKGKPTPTIEDLRKLTESDIMDIARTLFWDKIKGDQIKNQSIADLIFDFVWMSGLGYVRYIQRTLKITADGIFGNQTLTTLNQKSSQSLFDALIEQRKIYLANCNGSQYYLKGWLRRLNSFQYRLS